MFQSVQLEHKLLHGDYSDVESFAYSLRRVDHFSSFRSVEKKTLRVLDDLILKDIPAVMKGSGGVSGPVDEAVHEDEGDRSLILDGSDKARRPLQNTMLPLIIFGSAMFWGSVYISLFLFTMKNTDRTESSLPAVVIDHFVKVGQYIRTYVFDTIPSGDELI